MMGDGRQGPGLVGLRCDWKEVGKGKRGGGRVYYILVHLLCGPWICGGWWRSVYPRNSYLLSSDGKAATTSTDIFGVAATTERPLGVCGTQKAVEIV